MNRRGETVLTRLASEFDTADEIDLLCSFTIRWKLAAAMPERLYLELRPRRDADAADPR